jgi:hypothetical protein
MAYAVTTENHALVNDTLADDARAEVFSRLHIQAELGCLMCGRTVGDVIGNRIVQHRGCTGRLKVDRGLIRCCHCNGPVYREPMTTIAPR